MTLRTVKTYKLQLRTIKLKNRVYRNITVTLPETLTTLGWQKGDIIKVMLDDTNPTVIVLKNMSLEERLRRK